MKLSVRALLATVSSILVLGASLSIPTPSIACGGFFCTTAPIDQAGEQIVFRQDGSEITAMVRILYTGNPEDFSWVVPVPNLPELSVGSDTTFNQLEASTRPQFLLEQQGQVCEKDQIAFPVASPESGGDSGASDSGNGVTIEQELIVGPFDATIVSSDNPDDMALWLQDNGYQITDRGGALIAPYVNMGMKFVAIKLRLGETSGSIRPLIMKYQSAKPMVPIRLTAIAATDDMGVLVWIVNDARAIPENYEHVIPNYTRLNWFGGPFAAYASYQTLITDAMNDAASGQGFATDFAGPLDDSIYSTLSQPSDVQNTIDELALIANDAEYIEQSIVRSLAPTIALAVVQAALPLPDGSDDTSIYLDRNRLASTYTASELSAARTSIETYLADTELPAIRDSVTLLPQGSYLTRLYTTLSADEMSADPTFNFNQGMPEQSSQRRAQLDASCTDNVSEWTLTLGEGTGREGELIIRAIDQPIPFQGALPAALEEPAAYERQLTSADAQPESIFVATSSTLDIAADGSSTGGFSMSVAEVDNDNDFLGASSWWILLASAVLWLRRKTRAARLLAG